MAKYYGAIGFYETVEVEDGVFEERIIERKYSGDVTRTIQRWNKTEDVNDDIVIEHSISIIADTYAYENLHTIRYVTWMGQKWKVTSIQFQMPRLVLNVGGVYNG